MTPRSILDIIQAVKENRGDTLNLLDKGLKEIPPEVFDLPWLKTLLLGYNEITSIPPEIARLEHLQDLNLGVNKITEIPEALKQLKKLETLDLCSNNIKNVPAFLFSLGKIEQVFLKSGWSQGSLYLDLNPIETPPLEVLSQGMGAVRNYFAELGDAQSQNLFEAKLIIVGEPGAGKTTLCKKLLDANYQLNKDEKSTEGIEISKLNFEMEDANNFQINIWDFGGQEIYHATHQFFLTKRSLYILLEDTRAEDTDFNFWMQIIELLSDNSPVLIVQNEKQDRARDINELGLRGRFKNLLKVIKVNLKTNRGLKELINEVKYQIKQLDHIGTELPKVWVDIRKEIELASKKQDHISLNRYFKICTELGLNTKDRALFLSDYLHDLGVFLHFYDHPLLKKIVILRPEWGTDAVYKVLDNKNVRAQFGLFSNEDLKSIWYEEKYEDMQDELLALMMKFELCYQIENSNTFIAPQLLRASSPSPDWPKPKTLESLEVRYEYEFMPKGIITRFIVRRHYLIKEQKYVWKEGVILEKDGATAEVIETYGKKDILVRVRGKNRSELMTIILDEFDRIHRSYHNLKVAKLIPCKCPVCINNEQPYYFKYDLLKKFLAKGKKEIICGESVEDVSIEPLIKEISFEDDYPLVEAPPLDAKNDLSLKVFLSYSEKDKALKEELEMHLSAIKNLGVIDKNWDYGTILAGMNRKGTIEKNLKNADVILLLLSANFCASEFCTSKEMKAAIRRHEDKSALVIPVLLKPYAFWENLPFGHIQAVPKKGEAISSTHWPNKDEALQQVVLEIHAALEERYNL